MFLIHQSKSNVKVVWLIVYMSLFSAVCSTIGRKSRKKYPEPPQYMLDLYNRVADHKGETKAPLPFGASVVRAISECAGSDDRFVFSLEDVPANECVIEAEFRFHHRKLEPHDWPTLKNSIFYKFQVYISYDGVIHLVASDIVGGHANGWRTFSMGKVIQSARKMGIKKITFIVEPETMFGKKLPLRARHSFHGSKTPLLVLFNDVERRKDLSLYFTQALLRNRKRHKRSIADNSIDSMEPISTTTSISSISHASDSPSSGCELRSMEVDFKKIGWSSWIVYPRKYDAFQCVGKCSFPILQTMQPTNHATVQSIMREATRGGKRKGFDPVNGFIRHPSCVPTNHTSLALLFYDDNDNVIMKEFEEMVVTDCGCR